MKQYHPLVVAEKRNEADDAVRIALEVPMSLREEFEFQAGQHLPVQIERDGKKIRRTYSICSQPGDWPLQIGVRVQPGGKFSEFAAQQLQPGQQLDVMPPTGRFHLAAESKAGQRYVCFAAGSGITPILSIISELLHRQSNSTVALFYGNRTQGTTMFIDDLYALKNQFPDRLQLHFLFSREEQEFDIASGRIDEQKVRELMQRFCRESTADQAYICGPDSMIATVTETLRGLGLPETSIHSERFGLQKKPAGAKQQTTAEATETSQVTVLMDGHRKSFSAPKGGNTNIVDAAAAQGIDLPYSCKGGVCATCRTFVRSGEVVMGTNYGLEPWEVEKGFVLACQSTPASDQVLLDYDEV